MAANLKQMRVIGLLEESDGVQNIAVLVNGQQRRFYVPSDKRWTLGNVKIGQRVDLLMTGGTISCLKVAKEGSPDRYGNELVHIHDPVTTPADTKLPVSPAGPLPRECNTTKEEIRVAHIPDKEVIKPPVSDPVVTKPNPLKITIPVVAKMLCTINVQNYESIRLGIEGEVKSIEDYKALIDQMDSIIAYHSSIAAGTTAGMIDAYRARVFRGGQP
jgi:hypothetical protein